MDLVCCEGCTAESASAEVCSMQLCCLRPQAAHADISPAAAQTHLSICRYETNNHLWLILEFCVGGDLKTLLAEDRKLPESSVHDIGRDLLSALQCLHSKGIIHCDLKPSNIMMDENGYIKLSGFSKSRRLAHINAVPLSELQSVRSMSFHRASCIAPAYLGDLRSDSSFKPCIPFLRLHAMLKDQLRMQKRSCWHWCLHSSP